MRPLLLLLVSLVSCSRVKMDWNFASEGAPAGGLDSDFGTLGKTVIDIGTELHTWNLSVGPSGEVYVAGETYIPASAHQYVAVRLRADGIPDETWGVGGKRVGKLGASSIGSEGFRGVTVDSSGLPTFAGFALGSGSIGDFLVARFTKQGALDTTFNSPTGYRTIALGLTPPSNDAAYSILRYPATADAQAGKLLVIGIGSKTGQGFNFGLARLTADGALDTGFPEDGDANGTTMTNFDIVGGDKHDFALQGVFEPDGAVTLVGQVESAVRGVYVVGLARYQPNGQLHPNFGNFGNFGKVVLPALGTGTEKASGVSRQNDGKLLVTGSIKRNGQEDACVWRVDTTLALDTAFGSQGRACFELGAASGATASQIFSDGSIFLAGNIGLNEERDFLVIKLSSTGALDKSFGIGGVRRIDTGAHTEENVFGMATSPDGKILVSGSVKPTSMAVIRILP